MNFAQGGHRALVPCYQRRGLPQLSFEVGRDLVDAGLGAGFAPHGARRRGFSRHFMVRLPGLTRPAGSLMKKALTFKCPPLARVRRARVTHPSSVTDQLYRLGPVVLGAGAFACSDVLCKVALN